MAEPTLAVFDLDGTLVDTGPDLADTCDVVLRANGFSGVAFETVRPFIGFGAKRMLAGSMKAAGYEASPEQLDDLFAQYLDHYASRIAKLSRPFPEMLAALDTLDDAGARAAVCTNKREGLARLLLGELGMTDRFAAIVGADTFGVAKPDPLPLMKTIERVGGALHSTVFVGDSRIDRETAHNAKLPFVGVTYGYTDVEMVDLSPDRLCKPGDDVGAAILELVGVNPRVA